MKNLKKIILIVFIAFCYNTNANAQEIKSNGNLKPVKPTCECCGSIKHATGECAKCVTNTGSATNTGKNLTNNGNLKPIKPTCECCGSLKHSTGECTKCVTNTASTNIVKEPQTKLRCKCCGSFTHRTEVCTKCTIKADHTGKDLPKVSE